MYIEENISVFFYKLEPLLIWCITKQFNVVLCRWYQSHQETFSHNKCQWGLFSAITSEIRGIRVAIQCFDFCTILGEKIRENLSEISLTWLGVLFPKPHYKLFKQASRKWNAVGDWVFVKINSFASRQPIGFCSWTWNISLINLFNSFRPSDAYMRR